jgi:hypothetical protein
MSDQQQGPDWWLASDGKWYPPQSASPPPAFQPAAPPVSLPAHAWPTIGGAVVVMIAAFLPWATVTAPFIGQVSKNGIDGDGALTLIGGLVLAALAIPALRRQPARTGIGIAVAVVALLVAAIAAYDIYDVGQAVDAVGDAPVSASAAVGLYLTFAGGVASLVGGIMAVVASR